MDSALGTDRAKKVVWSLQEARMMGSTCSKDFRTANMDETRTVPMPSITGPMTCFILDIVCLARPSKKPLHFNCFSHSIFFQLAIVVRLFRWEKIDGKLIGIFFASTMTATSNKIWERTSRKTTVTSESVTRGPIDVSVITLSIKTAP